MLLEPKSTHEAELIKTIITGNQGTTAEIDREEDGLMRQEDQIAIKINSTAETARQRQQSTEMFHVLYSKHNITF